ncbi:DUF1799 domain-containing protein [Thermomonas haemolytica]|uniref:DUF1799 domain-containing protein n=1 Tax=Thermomonas haemolytica TaxID=141949 RepID=UPI0023DD88E9|nr:DUF1799 domain-containing protein [Thermomonas haemolytica]
MAPPDPEPEIELWPECMPSVEVFLACATQWRLDAAGNPLGMDYPALEAVMRMLGTADVRQTFADVQVMEAEVLRVFSAAGGAK